MVHSRWHFYKCPQWVALKSEWEGLGWGKNLRQRNQSKEAALREAGEYSGAPTLASVPWGSLLTYCHSSVESGRGERCLRRKTCSLSFTSYLNTFVCSKHTQRKRHEDTYLTLFCLAPGFLQGRA